MGQWLSILVANLGQWLSNLVANHIVSGSRIWLLIMESMALLSGGSSMVIGSWWLII
jgi:hypothetical protein